MKIRIEVGKSKSDAWLWFVRMAEKHPSHKIETSAGIEVRILELSRWEEVKPFWNTIVGWGKVAFYLDGRYLDIAEVRQLYYRAQGLDENGNKPRTTYCRWCKEMKSWPFIECPDCGRESPPIIESNVVEAEEIKPSPHKRSP